MLELFLRQTYDFNNSELAHICSVAEEGNLVLADAMAIFLHILMFMRGVGSYVDLQTYFYRIRTVD